MSELPAGGAAPQWDLADRLRKAMRHAGLGVQDMADYLDVTRGTVSTWINGRIVPSTQTIRLWSMRCGVSYEWLCGGQSPHATRGGHVTTLGVRKPGIFPALAAVAA